MLFYSSLFLLEKNPFDDQSLIPNLEPYPDSLYYAYLVWNVAHGGDFSMSYAGTTMKKCRPADFFCLSFALFAFCQRCPFFIFAHLYFYAPQLGLLIVCLKLISDRFKVPFYSKGVALRLYRHFLCIHFYILYGVPSLLMAELISFFVTFMWLRVLLLLPVNAQRASMSAHGAIFALW